MRIYKPNNPNRITLADTEVFVVEALAKKRTEINDENNVPRIILTGDPVEFEKQGCGAEFAFAKFANIYPDLEVRRRKRPYDCILGKFLVDVKQSKYSTGRLMVHTTAKPGEVDVYVLLRGELPTFTVIGWCYFEEVYRREYLQDPGNYKCPAYLLPNENLRPIEDLLKTAKE